MTEARSLDRDLRTAAKREALASSLWTDLVIYGLVAAAAGAVSMLSRGFDLYAAGFAASGAFVSLASLICTYVRHRRHFLALYLREWNARLSLVRDEQLVRLAARLESLGTKEGTTQTKRLKQAFGDFRKILERKFDVSELTYQRYDLILESLFLAALENLERAADTLEAAGALSSDEDGGFDPRGMGPSPDSLRDSAHELLGRNRAVLVALEKAGLRVSGVNTRRRKARVEMDAALDELSRMVDIAHRYAFDDA